MKWKSWIGRKFGLTDAAPWHGIYGSPNASGKVVTDATALNVPAAWACIRVNSEAVGALPLHLYAVAKDGSRELATDHPLSELLANPSADMTGTEFWSAVAAWLLARGNAYAEIVRNGSRIVALNLLPADSVSVTRDLDWNLHYQFSYRNRAYDLGPDDILHIRGWGMGGDLGLSPIRAGAQAIGTALAADEAAGRFLGNGLFPSGVFTLEEVVLPEHREQMKKIIDGYKAAANAGEAVLLEAGMKYEQLSLDPESMQMLESRRFNVEEICRLFGVPPVVIGHSGDGVTAWGSGIESLYLQWLQVGLDPIMTRIETRVRKQLLRPEERSRYVADFGRGELIRTDSAARASYLSTLTQNGLLTRNEGRRLLNMPPKPGGDDLTVQTALSPLQILGAIQGSGNVQAS